MRRRRESDDPYGVSLLDMLCCGFGAAALLFVLTELHADAAVRDQEAMKSALVLQNLATLERLEAFTSYAAAASRLGEFDAGNGLPRSAISDYGRLGNARRLVVLMDTSGSMAGWDRQDAARSREILLAPGGRAPESKWARATEVLAELVSGLPKLEALAVLRLGEGVQNSPDRCSGCPLVRNAVGGIWHDAKPAALALLVQAIRKVVPEGGSAHLPALSRALDLASAGDSGRRADTVIVVTDGLPNHGPSTVVDDPLHPAPGNVVSAESRLSRADAVLLAMRQRLPLVRASNSELRLHVICLDWPEDTELAGFALELANLGGGMITYPQRAHRREAQP